jgi:hypothetical protein
MAFQYNNISVDDAHINVDLTADGTSSSVSVQIPTALLHFLQIDGIGFPSIVGAPPTFSSEIDFTSITFNFDTGVLSFSLSSAPSSGQLCALSLVYGYTAN